MPRTKGSKGGIIGNNINKEMFETLCKMFCTETEICAVFKVSNHTLNDWCKITYGDTFISSYKQLRETGKVSLRRIQYQHAQKNPTMAIWLGKQYLDQTDKVEQQVTTGVSIVSDVKDEDAK